jgi:hypothetical protein
MDLTSTNGFDKSLKEVRADLVAQLKARATNGPIPSVARTQRKVDLELATEARVSVGLVHAARRLVRSGNEALIIAVLLGLLPIATASVLSRLAPMPAIRVGNVS